MRHRLVASTAGAAFAFTVSLLLTPGLGATADTLPASLSDREFWTLSEQLSEPNGAFQSDNLLSNEMGLSTVAAALAFRVRPGGVYLGVGPEQNFTYIAAIRPRMVFITDIRRGNLHLHLMYKALFELSADRAAFISRLFTKPRPAGLSAASTASDLLNAYWDVPTSDETAYQANLQAIKDHLVKTHRFPLSPEDLAGVEYVYRQFYWYGPAINYTSSTSGRWGGTSTYGDLMITRDALTGAERSYLASEDNFTFLKTLESKNLIVPLVGDFAGPKALRAVGAWLKSRDAVVTAFYLSNVESYLGRNGVWPAFCANVASMPLDEASSFIRPGMGSATIRFSVPSGTNTLPPASAAQLQQLLAQRTLVLGRGGIAGGPGRGSPFGAMATETANCSAK